MKNYQVRLVPKQDPSYAKAFELVREQYKKFYDAHLPEPDAPYFFVYEQNNEVLACISCSPALENSPMFSEHYLSEPLADFLPPGYPRKGLVEIGSLASIGDSFATQQLIRGAFMIGFFEYQWAFVLITVNPKIANLLKTCGLDFIHLSSANENQLPIEKQGFWGRYYQSKPSVKLVDSAKTISNHLHDSFINDPLKLNITGVRSR